VDEPEAAVTGTASVREDDFGDSRHQSTSLLEVYWVRRIRIRPELLREFGLRLK